MIVTKVNTIFLGRQKKSRLFMEQFLVAGENRWLGPCHLVTEGTSTIAHSEPGVRQSKLSIPALGPASIENLFAPLPHRVLYMADLCEGPSSRPGMDDSDCGCEAVSARQREWRLSRYLGLDQLVARGCLDVEWGILRV